MALNFSLQLLIVDGISIYNVFYRLDGKHTVFGKVVEGMDVVNSISAAGSANGKPKSEVVIVDCGVLDEIKETNTPKH